MVVSTNTKIPYHIVIDSIYENPKSWIDILSSLLTPAIAVLALYIAYQQYSVNRRRFRFEVYERRLAIYKTIQKFLNDILRDAATDYSTCSEFYSNTAESSFLLNKAIQNEIEEIFKKAIEMTQLHYQLYPKNSSAGLPIGDDRSIVAAKETEILKWLINQRGIVKELFQKEMSLK